MIDIDKIQTYAKRYSLLSDKIESLIDDARVGLVPIDHEYMERYIEILNQAVETQHDIITVYKEGTEKYIQEKNLLYSALRLYCVKYGSHIIVEKDVPDGTEIAVSVTVLPVTDRYLSVDVNYKIIGETDDSEHYRRRTRYQKIRDWFVLLRQSLQKP